MTQLRRMPKQAAKERGGITVRRGTMLSLLLFAPVMIVVLSNIMLARRTARPNDAGATISGSVRDVTNAMIPRAKLRLTDLASRQIYEATTNESGAFSFQRLPLGDYLLTISSPGFEGLEIGPIRLRTSTHLRLPLAGCGKIDLGGCFPLLLG